MLKGITKRGFRYEISDETLDNYELFELFAVVDSNPLVLPRVAELMLGAKQYNVLKKKCSNKAGIVSTKKMMEEIETILKESKKVKN